MGRAASILREECEQVGRLVVEKQVIAKSFDPSAVHGTHPVGVGARRFKCPPLNWRNPWGEGGRGRG